MKIADWIRRLKLCISVGGDTFREQNEIKVKPMKNQILRADVHLYFNPPLILIKLVPLYPFLSH
jgi:hypothetical protein